MVTNIEVAKLHRFLASPAADSLVLTLKGNLAVQQNLKSTKDFYDTLAVLEQKQMQKSPAFLEYEAKQTELVEKYAERDSDGNPVKVAGGTRIGNLEDFNKDMEVLMETYKEDIEAHRRKLIEWEQYALAPYDGKLKLVDQADIEFEKLPKADFQAFQIMIEQFQEELAEDPAPAEDETQPEKAEAITN